jgi:protein TonB
MLGALTPPRPLVGVANQTPEYPFPSRMRGEQGVVTLRIDVDAAGRVVDIEVHRSAGFAALDEAAMRAVRRWRFEPAMRDGKAVVSTAAVDINFRLQGDRRW